MDQAQAALGKAMGEQGEGGVDLKAAAAKGLEGVKAQVAEGLADSGGGGAGAGAGAGSGEAGKAGGVDTAKLQAAATAYAKGEGDVEDVKKAATDTAASLAQGFMK